MEVASRGAGKGERWVEERVKGGGEGPEGKGLIWVKPGQSQSTSKRGEPSERRAKGRERTGGGSQ